MATGIAGILLIGPIGRLVANWRRRHRNPEAIAVRRLNAARREDDSSAAYAAWLVNRITDSPGGVRSQQIFTSLVMLWLLVSAQLTGAIVGHLRRVQCGQEDIWRGWGSALSVFVWAQLGMVCAVLMFIVYFKILGLR